MLVLWLNFFDSLCLKVWVFVNTLIKISYENEYIIDFAMFIKDTV